MEPLDLLPATERLASLVASVGDHQLAAPTPCPEMSVGALLDHVVGLSAAFTGAARKEPLEGAPSADASRLPDDFRTSIPAALGELAAAWKDPAAWQGMTRAGGLDLPGEVAGLVALDEVVLHGWDLARATGQPFDVVPDLLEAVHGFVQSFSAPEMAGQREGLFGPVVPVPEDAPLLDRVLGLSGRDPGWSPASIQPVTSTD